MVWRRKLGKAPTGVFVFVSMCTLGDVCVNVFIYVCGLFLYIYKEIHI